ncbi:MAG: DEAD/DEAH box helicase [Pirellulales bacterium]
MIGSKLRANNRSIISACARQAYLNGCSGLIHTPTGTGKTLAAFLGAIIEAESERVHIVADSESSEKATTKARATKRARAKSKLKVLWLTPLRALAADTEEI